MTPTPEPTAAPPEPPLEWSVNPWVTHPRGALAGVAAALALGALAFALAGPAAVGATLAVACALALAPSFVPVRYRVDAEGIAMRRGLGWERRPWSQVKRAAARSRGVLVSPLAKPSFRDSYRGLFLEVPQAGPAGQALLGELERRLALRGL